MNYILTDLTFVKVWFQNRRAKFRKQERLAQQKVSNSSNPHSNSTENLSQTPTAHVKSENKSSSSSMGNTTPKDLKPGSPLSTVSTTPNSSASSHLSNADVKPINGKLK